ncbi:hypothetical protein ACFWBF_28540 [Streptomyces sp. NPDC060028]
MEQPVEHRSGNGSVAEGACAVGKVVRQVPGFFDSGLERAFGAGAG